MSAAWRAIQRGSWGGLVVIAILTAFNIYALIGTSLPFIRTLQTGTLALRPDQILAMGPTPNEFQTYKIAGSEMFNTNFTYISTLSSRGIQMSETTTYYGFLVVGDKLLLVSSASRIDETKLTYTGSFDDFMYEDVLTSLTQKFPEIQGNLLPIYFHETYEMRDFVWVIIATQIIITLITIYALWRFVSVTLFKQD